MSIRLVNWNFERRGPQTWQAASLITEISAYAPDLICLTEAHAASLDALDGHVIAHIGYRAEHKKPSERLVLLWSSRPWQRIDIPEPLQSAGGLVAGITSLAGQDVLCVGVCIPYHMAKLANEQRTMPWHHHKRFLTLLQPWLADRGVALPVIILGDFNQRIPRTRASRGAYDMLRGAFAPFEIITAGEISPLDEQTIDHVALAGELKPLRVEARSRFDQRGKPRSDHFGVFATLDFS